MSRFRYIAYDAFGRKQSGYVEAETKEVAIARVKSKGLQPTALFGPYGKHFSAGGLNLSHVRMKSLAAYTRKFSQLYNAGVGLDEIFAILAQEEDVRILRNVSKDLVNDISQGMQIEEALHKYPLIFPPLFVALFRTGMESGTLDLVADRLAGLYEKESALRTQMWSKLAYPIALLAIAIFVSIAMSRFGALPQGLATAIVLFWGVIIALVFFFSTPAGYPILRSLLLFTPYIGSLMLKTNLSRFCRILSLLYNSGMPLLEALDHAQQTLQDPRLTASIKRVKQYVNEGDDLASAMKKAGMIPSRVISMVAVGERGGEVDQVLDKMSAYYDIEIEHHHQVLLVTGYFVSYLLVALTIGIIVISFWSGYFGRVMGLINE